jgi:hypothetical protein
MRALVAEDHAALADRIAQGLRQATRSSRPPPITREESGIPKTLLAADGTDVSAKGCRMWLARG